MSTVSLKLSQGDRARLPRIGPLPPGLSTHLVRDPEQGDAELLALAGLRTSESAQLLIDARAPQSSAALRARIGLLLACEPSTHFDTSVEGHLRMARTYRRAAGASFDEAFGDALLGPLLKRSSGSLNEPERRAVALTLALELDTPSVLLLYEPRATPLDFAKVRERYSHHAHLAPVLVVSDRERELLHFGSRRFGESRQGRTLHRIVATRVNELARVLESKGHQVAVLAEMTGTGLLEVRADSPENLSALLLESCRACGAELRSLRWEKGDE